MNNVRVRFAPSPTGIPHIGNIRLALFDWLFAKKNKGKFILRIEDTDRKRFDPNSLEAILASLRFLGLNWDEGPYFQSQRIKQYKEFVNQLLVKNYAYYCFCSEERLEEMRKKQRAKGLAPKYDRFCLGLSKATIKQKLAKGNPYVIRLKIPDEREIEWDDLIQGKIKINTETIDDQILIKSDGFPTYHLAVVVDDHLMQISHVFRGVEWISSTPKHLILFAAFGWQPPKIGHFPLVLGPDKTKLSKRHGAKSILDYKNAGYLPEALINFIALLGWHPKDDQEILTVSELIKKFDLNDVQRQNAIFDEKRLNYLNGYYIRQKSNKKLGQLLEKFIPEFNFDQRILTAALVKERIKNLLEARELISFVFQDVDYSPELLLQKGFTKDEAKLMLIKAKQIIQKQKNLNNSDILQKQLLDLIRKNNWQTGNFFMVFRIAVTGKTITPPIVESLRLLPKEKVIERLDQAIKKLALGNFKS